jgi:lipopolysaccharide transport system permease protein
MFSTARSIFRYRSLLATLTGRELKARYRGSALGYLWSLANPLLLVLVYTFVFSYVFSPRDPEIKPYGLFLVSGLFPWIWFQTALTEGADAVYANAGLIRKATFPIALLPLVAVLANLAHLVFSLPMIALAFLFFRQQGFAVGGASAVLLPLIIGLQLPMIAGLTLGLAALNAHFKDIKDILNNALTLLFYLTPILYSTKMLDSLPWIGQVVKFNPLTPFALSYQQVLFFDQLPLAGQWLGMALVSLACWTLGAGLFARLSETLVEAV